MARMARAAVALALVGAASAVGGLRGQWRHEAQMQPSAMKSEKSEETAPSWRPKCKPEHPMNPKSIKSLTEGERGEYELNSCDGVYMVNPGLANAIAELTKNEDVVELGAGCGCYTGRLLDNGVKSVTAFDGIKNVANLTSGLVRTADLSKDIRDQIPDHSWTICTEVGEHIDKQFENVLFRNIVEKARQGVVLSWAVPGQGGDHHVNEKDNAAVKDKMEGCGFRFWEGETSRLRQSLTPNVAAGWFKNTIMVFNKTAAPPKPECAGAGE